MCWLVLDWSVKIPLSSQMDPVLETAQADTSSIGVLQHPFGARCIVGGPGDAMLERLQRKMDYGMQALNLILVRFLQRKMTSKSVEHSLCEYFKFCRAAKGHLVETGNVESSISLNIYSNPFSLQVWWMGNSVSRWKLHR